MRELIEQQTILDLLGQCVVFVSYPILLKSLQPHSPVLSKLFLFQLEQISPLTVVICYNDDTAFDWIFSKFFPRRIQSTQIRTQLNRSVVSVAELLLLTIWFLPLNDTQIRVVIADTVNDPLIMQVRMLNLLLNQYSGSLKRVKKRLDAVPYLDDFRRDFWFDNLLASEVWLKAFVEQLAAGQMGWGFERIKSKIRVIF